MPRKKKTEDSKELSPFNREMIDALQKYLRKRTLTVDIKAKAVTLTVDMAGRPVIFAGLRSPFNIRADVRLYGYLPESTSLNKKLQEAMVPERGGANGWFLKLQDPHEAAQAIFLHFKDVDSRVKTYAKANKVKAGERPRRTWEARGIPFSFFK